MLRWKYFISTDGRPTNCAVPSVLLVNAHVLKSNYRMALKTKFQISSHVRSNHRRSGATTYATAMSSSVSPTVVCRFCIIHKLLSIPEQTWRHRFFYCFCMFSWLPVLFLCTFLCLFYLFYHCYVTAFKSRFACTFVRPTCCSINTQTLNTNNHADEKRNCFSLVRFVTKVKWALVSMTWMDAKWMRLINRMLYFNNVSWIDGHFYLFQASERSI